MANAIPIEVDTTDPDNPVVRRMPAGTNTDPSRLPAATGAAKGAVLLATTTPAPVGASGAVGVDAAAVARADHAHAHGDLAGGALHAAAVPSGAAGFMSGAQAQQLADTPAAISSAVAGEASARATAVSSEATARAAADAALQAELDALEAAAATGAANVTSTGSSVPPEAELGIFRDKSGNTLNLRTLCGQLGLSASIVDGSIRVARRPKLWHPRGRARAEQYQRRRCKGRKSAGAVGDNAASGPDYFPTVLLENHGASDHLGPFMVYTAVDTTGLVHKFHRRLRGSSLSDASAVKGYEYGEPVAAGDARDGHRFLWRLAGGAENVGWANAFWDFRIEINPTAGNFAGANLLSLIGPELGATWAGELSWSASIELLVTGPTSCEARGVWTLFSASGAVLHTWERSAKLTGAHNWLTTDARLQLRWRVDRDPATRANTFDWSNQGERQGANVLRLHVDRYEFEPIGFLEE